MADYLLAGGTPYTTYNTASGNFIANTSYADTITITDADGGDTEFDTVEPLQATFAPATVLGGAYIGFINVSGTNYPVIELGNGQTVVFGVHVDGVAFPTVGDLRVSTANFTVCFGAGTMIQTAIGEVKVEALAIGDILVAADGHKTAVKWVGIQHKIKVFAGTRMQPVRIRADALGNSLPHSDLTVTADHGMVLDGLVVNASALVNGHSIDWVPMAELPDSVTWYHIETEAHDVILANGAPSETFVDAVGRAAFDNHAEYLGLYGAERIIPEMDRPRITSARLLPDAIRARLGIFNEVTKFEDVKVA